MGKVCTGFLREGNCRPGTEASRTGNGGSAEAQEMGLCVSKLGSQFLQVARCLSWPWWREMVPVISFVYGGLPQGHALK